MENTKRKFPYWIHIVLGLIWIVVGVAFHTGWELAIWVAGGVVMFTIGLLNKNK